MITTFVLMAALTGQVEDVEMKFVASGATRQVGGYRPIRAEMNAKKELVKVAPENLESPKYGQLKLGSQSWTFILDERAEKDHTLYVDTNGDGDLTNDPEASWKPRTSRGQTMYNGSAELDLGDGKLGAINLYRFDPKDPRRAVLKNTVLFYTDYGHELALKLDGKKFTTFVAGELQPGTRLWIDRDGNKKRSSNLEMISVGQPFNFTGTTYELRLEEGVCRLAEAGEPLPQAPLPPDLSLGKQALEFTMTATDGEEIEFPQTYAGKLVMLDFWATWCGPCIAELPNVKQAYADWHDQGFDILSISFDRAGMDEKLAAFIEKNEMGWRHIYEGKGWQTSLGQMYDVSGIPFVLLVDGDSGKILGTSRELRGPGLSKFIEKALKEKQE